jgi:hypothetical protein
MISKTISAILSLFSVREDIGGKLHDEQSEYYHSLNCTVFPSHDHESVIHGPVKYKVWKKKLASKSSRISLS